MNQCRVVVEKIEILVPVGVDDVDAVAVREIRWIRLVVEHLPRVPAGHPRTRLFVILLERSVRSWYRSNGDRSRDFGDSLVRSDIYNI